MGRTLKCPDAIADIRGRAVHEGTDEGALFEKGRQLRANAHVEPNCVGSVGGGVRHYLRWSTATQLFSQVTPPSAEYACSNSASFGDTLVITKRTRIARPARVSGP